MALMRIGVVLLLWSRLGPELALSRSGSSGEAALSLAFFAATALWLCGALTRVAGAVSALCVHALVYGFALHGERADLDHHVTRLLCSLCLLLALAPTGRSYSIDRLRRPDLPERANLWPMRLVALQVSAVYFWSAYDKTTPGFLGGDRLTHYLMNYVLGSGSLQSVSWLRPLTSAVAIGVVAIEYGLAFGLFFARTRRVMLWLGFALHASFALALPVGSFSLTMWLAYLAFLDPDEVHRTLDRLGTPGPLTQHS
jgi:hypothetical protein